MSVQHITQDLNHSGSIVGVGEKIDLIGQINARKSVTGRKVSAGQGSANDDSKRLRSHGSLDLAVFHYYMKWLSKHGDLIYSILQTSTNKTV